jgi:hypothetical protein
LTRARVSPGLAFAAACLALHLAFNGGYGVFRDELYFIVCGLHPAFGYVDQPPITPLTAAAVYKLFGPNPWTLRLVPALAMSATVWLSARLAAEFGASRFGQGLAALATLLAPVLLVDGLLLITDFLQPLTWTALSYCLVRLVATSDERWWLAAGAVIGVSFESKYLIAYYVAGLALGALATPLRRSLARPWIYAGAALALALAAPNLVWQAAHGWPFLEIGRAGIAGKNAVLSPYALFGQIALFLGPVSAPLWIAGLLHLAAQREKPAWRALPIAGAAIFAFLCLTHGKAYYLAAFGPSAFAAGGAALARLTERRPRGRVFLAAVFTLGGLVTLPISLPILPPEKLVAYQAFLGLGPSVSATERGAASPLPQYFADMFGWREMAAEVARVYRALPEDERAKAVFFGRNYGEAAAVEIYGPQYGGPPAISGHNNYFLWGPQGFDGSTVIALGSPNSTAAQGFASVTVAGRLENKWARPPEADAPVLILRQPRASLDALWPKLKHYE